MSERVRRGPLVFAFVYDVQTDFASVHFHVRMEHFLQELALRRSERIVMRTSDRDSEAVLVVEGISLWKRKRELQVLDVHWVHLSNDDTLC